MTAQIRSVICYHRINTSKGTSRWGRGNASRFPPLDQTLRIHLERNEAYSRKGIESSCNIFLSDNSRIASRSIGRGLDRSMLDVISAK